MIVNKNWLSLKGPIFDLSIGSSNDNKDEAEKTGTRDYKAQNGFLWGNNKRGEAG